MKVITESPGDPLEMTIAEVLQGNTFVIIEEVHQRTLHNILMMRIFNAHTGSRNEIKTTNFEGGTFTFLKSTLVRLVKAHVVREE